MEDKSWYLYIVDHHEGPFSVDEIKKLVKNGEAKSSSYVWKQGLSDWTVLSDVRDFNADTSKIKAPKTETPKLESVKAQPGGPDLSDVSPNLNVFCLNRKGIFSGPHSQKYIVQKLIENEVTPSDSIWKEGWTTFVQLSKVTQLMDQVSNKKDSEAPEPSFFKNLVLKLRFKKKQPLKTIAPRGESLRKWYQSPFYIGCFVCLFLVSMYHGLTSGLFRPLLKNSSVQAKLDSLNLPPLSMNPEFLNSISKKARPHIHNLITMLPPKLRSYVPSFLMVVKIPEGISPSDAERLANVILADPNRGTSAATAMPLGAELNPVFYIGTNAPNQTSLTLKLEGKPGTLVDAFHYKKHFKIVVSDGLGKTQEFVDSEKNSLPKGEYLLTVSTKNTNGIKVLVEDKYFLGGKKDATYFENLKITNEKRQTKASEELKELNELFTTVESMANESATKFFEFNQNGISKQEKELWRRYSGQYTKLSNQLSEKIRKNISPEIRMKTVYYYIYDDLSKTLQLTSQLHQDESTYVGKMEKASKDVSIDSIQYLAQKVVHSLEETKAKILNAN